MMNVHTVAAGIRRAMDERLERLPGSDASRWVIHVSASTYELFRAYFEADATQNLFFCGARLVSDPKLRFEQITIDGPAEEQGAQVAKQQGGGR